MADQKLPETTVVVLSPSGDQHLERQFLLPEAGQPPPSTLDDTTGDAIQVGNAQKTSLGPKKKHLRDIYWASPASMLSLLLFGIAMSVGHHFYYNSLVGKVVGDENDQQRTHRVGNFFAFVVQSSLAASMSSAYVQRLWMTLKKREVTIGTLNSAFSARSSLLFIFNWEMIRKIKVGSLIALTAWCLPIPSLFTPATLFVNPTNATALTKGPVPRLAIADPSQANFFAYSVPPDGVNSTNASRLFLGPRTIVERLSVATAALGEILPMSPPFANSSYKVKFHGPMVHCQPAYPNVSAIIENQISEQMKTQNNITELLNAYYAYVPDLSVPENAGISVNRLQQRSDGSNQLWLSFKRNGTGYTDQPIPTCPITEYRICQLYNASYDLNLTFVEGNQTISGYPPTLLHPVDYPVNLTPPSDMAQHSYSAYMWAFTNQLVGSMGFYNDISTNKSTPVEYSEIKSGIEGTSLLGSSDLDCFFVTNDAIFDGSNATNSTISPQRQQDIKFARNETLDVLIPELAFNTTVSLMNDLLLAPKISTTIYTTQSINQYAYHSSILLLAYSISILVSLIANILGVYAYCYNKVAHDISFSSLVSSTTDETINRVFRKESPDTHGKLPLPQSIKTVEIKFTPLDEGGLGFQTATEVKRRQNSAASPQLEALAQEAIVVEPITTHDRTPCCTAWSRSAIHCTRPQASIQIYDTSPSSNSQSHISGIAEKLQEIFGPGPGNAANYQDRLDAYGLTIDENANEDSRVAKCIEHQRAEIASREERQPEEGKPWYIQRWDNGPNSKYGRFIVVIDTEMGRWEEAGMLFVWFDVTVRERGEDEAVKNVWVQRQRGDLAFLRRKLGEVRLSFNWELGKEQFDNLSGSVQF